MAANHSKNRKTDAQEIFDEAQNMGRFAGNDKDAKEAREQAIENIKEQNVSANNSQSDKDQNSDAMARRDPAQAHDYKGEAQDVNYGDGRPSSEEELRRERDKATEGKQQGRSDSNK